MTSTNLMNFLLTTVIPEDEESEGDRYIAASIILTVRLISVLYLLLITTVVFLFQVAICGLIANTSAIIIIGRSKHLHNCFGYLLLLHASAEAVVLCSFAFWAAPVTLL